MDSTRVRCGWIALAAILAGGCAAPGAVIRGTLRIPQTTSRSGLVAGRAEPSPNRWTSVEPLRSDAHRGTRSTGPARSAKPSSTDSGDETITDAVLFLDRMPAPSARSRAVPPPPHPPARMAAEAAGFSPRVVAVSRGDTVTFVNHDRKFHNAFSMSPARRFDLGTLAPGAERRVMFDRTGVVRVFCNLHPDSSSYVYVVPYAQWTRPDRRGQFALPALPPGSYRLRAWHPRYGERHWAVQLARAGRALDLGF